MKKFPNKTKEELTGDGVGSNPFVVPSGYFDELKTNISNSLDTVPDTEKAATTNPFNVPSDYFENLSIKISDRISARNAKAGFTFRRVVISLAACSIIIAAIFIFNRPEKKIQDEEKFTASDIQNSDYLLMFDDNLLSEFIGSTSDTLNDSYEQYLIDNNIEQSQIENAL